MFLSLMLLSQMLLSQMLLSLMLLGLMLLGLMLLGLMLLSPMLLSLRLLSQMLLCLILLSLIAKLSIIALYLEIFQYVFNVYSLHIRLVIGSLLEICKGLSLFLITPCNLDKKLYINNKKTQIVCVMTMLFSASIL